MAQGRYHRNLFSQCGWNVHSRY